MPVDLKELWTELRVRLDAVRAELTTVDAELKNRYDLIRPLEARLSALRHMSHFLEQAVGAASCSFKQSEFVSLEPDMVQEVQT